MSSANATTNSGRSCRQSASARLRYARDETRASALTPESERSTFSPTVAASLRAAQRGHMSKSQSLQRHAPPRTMRVPHRSQWWRATPASKKSGCACTAGRKSPSSRVSSLMSSRATYTSTLTQSTERHIITASSVSSPSRQSNALHLSPT